MTDIIRSSRLAQLHVMRAHLPFLTLAACVGLASIAGCHRARQSNEWMSTSGYRYSAGAAVVGPGHDTLRVAVVVVNESTQRRALPLNYCPLYGNPVKARLVVSGRYWNSEINEEKPRPVVRDSTGQPVIEACASNLVVMTFPPGASHTSVLKVPIREILGDSLPSGRYKVTARLVGVGGDGRKLDAGEVVID
jgi:hypothetical protein